MKNSKYSRILDHVLDEKVPHDHHLAPQILAKLQKNKGANMSKRMKVLVPILIVMLAVFLFTVPAVAQAIQRWIGYVPGFGLVENSNIRTMSTPVQVTQNDVILTVSEVTASTTKTVIKYRLDNLPTKTEDKNFLCEYPDHATVIVLPDGSKPDLQGATWGYSERSMSMEITYSGIPAEVNEMIMTINCVSQTNPDVILWDWSVPLSFDPQSPTLTMAPVFEVPMATEQTEAANTEISAKLEVKQIITLADGYILSGSMSVDPVNGLTVEESDRLLEDMVIKDANDVALNPAMVPDDFIIEGNFETTNQFNWAVQITGKDIVWPLTITVNSVTGITPAYPMATFQVDVGASPYAGQEWKINQDVPLGPKTVHVVSCIRLKGEHGLDGYELRLLYDPAIALNFEIEGANPNGGGGSGEPIAGEEYSIARSYAGNVPTGLLTFELNGYGIERIHGPWQVMVEEPEIQ